MRRDSVAMIPESEEDIAYIEDTLGLKADGDAIRFVRENALQLSSVAWVRTYRADQKRLCEKGPT